MKHEPIWESEEEDIGSGREYWNEEDWERFMTQQDRKVDELMRLSDLFMNSGMNPRDDLELEDPMDCDGNCSECPERYSCSEHQDRLSEESREATGVPEPVEEEDEFDIDRSSFRSLPVYQVTFEFGVATYRWLHELPDEDFDRVPALDTLAAQCGIPGAKIAGGHGFGYRPDSICGNIVNCRRGETAMAASVEALQALLSHPEYAEKARDLKQQADEALRLIRERIALLRAEARRLHGESG